MAGKTHRVESGLGPEYEYGLVEKIVIVVVWILIIGVVNWLVL